MALDCGLRQPDRRPHHRDSLLLESGELRESLTAAALCGHLAGRVKQALVSVLQASEFFLFAGLMLAVMVLFIWLAMRYTYVENSSEDEDSDATGPAGEARQMDVIANGEKSEKS